LDGLHVTVGVAVMRLFTFSNKTHCFELWYYSSNDLSLSLWRQSVHFLLVFQSVIVMWLAFALLV